MLDLEARLKARVEFLLDVPVFTDPDLKALAERFARTPNGRFASVIWTGLNPIGAGTGEEQDITHQFLVVLGIKNARDTQSGEAARADGQPLLDALLAGLLNWCPGDRYGRLQLERGPRPDFAAGYLYLPIAVSCRVTVRGQPY